MNLFSRRCFSLFAFAALTIAPLTAPGQDAASAKTTFDAVNKHLDLGGQLYAFLNVDGDFTELSAKAQELYQELQQTEGFDLPPGLDIAALLGELGLDNLKAAGLSSIKFGQGYRNRLFAAVDGERQGILRLTGGEPRPFTIGEFAPASAMWAMESDVDFASIKDLMTAIGGQLEQTLGMDPLSGALQQPIPGTQLNVSQLVDTLKGELMAYVLVDETQTLVIPEPGAPEIPGIDAVLTHSNGKEIFGHIRSFITSNAPPDAYTEEVNEGVTQLKIQLPDEATLGFYAPLIQFDEATEQLLIATRPEALTTVTVGDRLSTNADFKRMADLLPQEGSGYGYMSPQFYDFIEIFMEAASQGDALMGEVQKEIMALVYGDPQPMAGMWANRDDGIYMESLTPMSYKLSLAYTAILPAAVAAGVAAPMMIRAQSQALDIQRRQIQEAQETLDNVQ